MRPRIALLTFIYDAWGRCDPFGGILADVKSTMEVRISIMRFRNRGLSDTRCEIRFYQNAY